MSRRLDEAPRQGMFDECGPGGREMASPSSGPYKSDGVAVTTDGSASAGSPSFTPGSPSSATVRRPSELSDLGRQDPETQESREGLSPRRDPDTEADRGGDAPGATPARPLGSSASFASQPKETAPGLSNGNLSQGSQGEREEEQEGTA